MKSAFLYVSITKIHHLSCCFGGFCHSPLADLSRPLSLSLSYKHPSFSPKFCGLSALFTSAVLTLPTSILLTEDWGSTKRITIMSLRTPGLPPPINKWGSNTQSETGNGICALPLKWFYWLSTQVFLLFQIPEATNFFCTYRRFTVLQREQGI